MKPITIETPPLDFQLLPLKMQKKMVKYRQHLEGKNIPREKILEKVSKKFNVNFAK